MRPLICTLLLLCACVPAFTEDAPKDKPAQAGKDAAAAKDEISISEINAKGIADLKSIAASDGGLTADFALINALIRKRDFDAAAAAIQAAEKKDGKNPSLAQLRGGMELSRGKTGEARAAFEAALKLDPTYLPAIAALTQLDVGENKFSDAIARFERALAKDPKNR